MRFKIDENLPQESADLLRQASHDAVTVIAQRMGGGPDPNLATVCNSKGRVLVTLDLDFADIRAYPRVEYRGFIVLRPTSQAKSHVLNLLQLAIERLPSEELTGKLWVVDEGGIRIRESD
jgi:predicted nuclease of predicted toxin-antitoxin system